MAVLEKIRVKLGILISILIAVALLSFIIDPNTLGSTLQSMSKENNVGYMDGKRITYREYFTAVEQNSALIQALTGGSNTEQTQNQAREMAWNQLYNQRVFFPKIKDAGFSVEDAEMLDLLQGENPSPLISQQQMFVGEDGQFSPAAVKDFVANMDLDERGISRQYWEYLKEQVYAQQMYGKYNAALRNSETLSPLQAERAIADGNTVKDIDWVMVPISFAVDTTLNITSAEVSKYYNDRKQMFRQPANRDIEYVMFEVVPSQEDIDEIKAGFDELYAQFAEAENLKNFIALNSDRRWDDTFYSREEVERMSSVFADYAFGAPAAASAIDSTAEAFSAVRVAERKNLPDSVNISYAVFPATESAKADSLFAAVRKNGSSEDLVPMGWATMASLAANGMEVFDEAFEMKPGEVRLINIDQYQMVAVLKAEQATKAKEKVKLALLRKNISPSESTYRDFNLKAADLADRSDGKYEKFAQIVKDENLPVIPMDRVTIDTRRIGVCENARAVVHWVFDSKTRTGSVSDVIPVENKYFFVAAVTKDRKEGYTPVEEVKDGILTQLINEKKVEKLLGELAEQVSESATLDQIAGQYNVIVNHKDGISFESTDMSLEPALQGAVAAAEADKRFGPVKGSIGAYYFKVTEAATGEYYTEADALNRNAQKAFATMQNLKEIISEEAEIKDYRAKFY